MDSKSWAGVYRAKAERQVSWFQEVPEKSLELNSEMRPAPDDSIIDIGGGDPRLVNHLYN